MNAKASIAFLKEAAAYFSKQPTDGEDSKHWANVLNSENCTHAAEVITSQASRIAELEKALVGLVPGSRDPDGKCWCTYGHNVDFGGHQLSCLAARAVLSTQAAE